MENIGTLKELRFERQAYSLGELASAYGVSVPFLRLETKRGKLKVLRFGRRVVVTKQALEQYLRQAEL